MESSRQRKITIRQPDFIMARRKNPQQNNRVEYLVHWQGKTHAEDTWEPCITMDEYKPMVRDFLQKDKEEKATINSATNDNPAKTSPESERKRRQSGGINIAGAKRTKKINKPSAFDTKVQQLNTDADGNLPLSDLKEASNPLTLTPESSTGGNDDDNACLTKSTNKKEKSRKRARTLSPSSSFFGNSSSEKGEIKGVKDMKKSKSLAKVQLPSPVSESGRTVRKKCRYSDSDLSKSRSSKYAKNSHSDNAQLTDRTKQDKISAVKKSIQDKDIKTVTHKNKSATRRIRRSQASLLKADAVKVLGKRNKWSKLVAQARKAQPIQRRVTRLSLDSNQGQENDQAKNIEHKSDATVDSMENIEHAYCDNKETDQKCDIRATSKVSKESTKVAGKKRKNSSVIKGESTNELKVISNPSVKKVVCETNIKKDTGSARKLLKKAINRRKKIESNEEGNGDNKKVKKILGRRRRFMIDGQKKSSIVEYFVRWEDSKQQADSWLSYKDASLSSLHGKLLIKNFIEECKLKLENFSTKSGRPIFLDKKDENAAKASSKSTYINQVLATSPYKHSPPSFKMKTKKRLLTSPVVDMKSMQFHSKSKNNKKSRRALLKKNFVNKPLANVKAETASNISTSSSDDDTRYSLPQCSQSKVHPPASSRRSKPRKPSTLHIDVQKAVEMAQSKTSTPDTDPEISFKTSPSKKMLLIDSIRPKSGNTDANSGGDSAAACFTSGGDSGEPQTGASPANPLPPPTPNSTPYKTPPSSPGKEEPTPTKADTAMGLSNDLPIAMPTSPSATSYKSLMKNLSSLPSERGVKRQKVYSSLSSTSSEVERRVSVRSSESAFKYKDIVVKKCTGFTQITLNSQTRAKNALNPNVFKEIQQVLHNAKFDDSRLILLTGSGNIFSSGVDLDFLLRGDRRVQAKLMADGIRDFVTALLNFPKPIMVAVNGPAIGLGVTMLPLCDIVYASDKATFYCPYSRLAQSPEGGSTYTFPDVLGLAMANDVLLGGRRLTAIEAGQAGLVSQVLWPTTIMQEVVPRAENMARAAAKAMETTKLLIRSHTKSKLTYTIESECQLLAERWVSGDCQRAMTTFVNEEEHFL